MVKPKGVTTQIKALDEFIVMVMFSFVTAEESIFLAIFYYWDSKAWVKRRTSHETN